MKLETRIYGWLLRAYPKEFRLDFETEMLQVFRVQLEVAKLERQVFSFWLHTLKDTLFSIIREHTQKRRFAKKQGLLKFGVSLVLETRVLRICLCVTKNCYFKTKHDLT